MESRQWILTWLLIIFHPLEAAKEDKGETWGNYVYVC
jgi:hypothetical protein